MNTWILLPVLLPAVTGIALLAASFREHLAMGRPGKTDGELSTQMGRKLHTITAVVLVLTTVLALLVAWSGEHEVTLFYLMEDIPVYFHIDAVGRLFVTVVSIVWLCVGFYSFTYMEHEGEEKRFFGFFLLVYAVLIALDFSGNLVTMYLFYELMTLCSMPLVLHNGSREAIMAALKYLFYSMCGAYLGLFGIFCLYHYCDTLAFTAGGTLDGAAASGHTGLLLVAVLAMLIGFGAKAGMFPLHAWLPAAHPVAPSPASAALSGIIVKSGVLAVIRVVFYIAGPDLLRGTWVQNIWMTLTLLTVFMGSLLAFREPVLKKRLAYSTVQPGFVHPVRSFCAAAGSDERCADACRISCVHQVRIVSDSRSFHFQIWENKGGRAGRNRKTAAEDTLVLHVCSSGIDRYSADERFYQ